MLNVESMERLGIEILSQDGEVKNLDVFQMNPIFCPSFTMPGRVLVFDTPGLLVLFGPCPFLIGKITFFLFKFLELLKYL